MATACLVRSCGLRSHFSWHLASAETDVEVGALRAVGYANLAIRARGNLESTRVSFGRGHRDQCGEEVECCESDHNVR
jgi:hypothetical protein